MKYLIKWGEMTNGFMLGYEKEVEASDKKEALKKMGKKLKSVTAIYLKLN